MKKLWVLLMTVFVLSGFECVQEIAITGKVSSAEGGSPLPGVNVQLKGTTNSTVQMQKESIQSTFRLLV